MNILVEGSLGVLTLSGPFFLRKKRKRKENHLGSGTTPYIN